MLATYTYDPLSRRTNLAYPHASAGYSYSPAGNLLTLNHSIVGTGTVPQYTLGYTAAHKLNSEASSQSSYLWQPAATGNDTYAAANDTESVSILDTGGQLGTKLQLRHERQHDRRHRQRSALDL